MKQDHHPQGKSREKSWTEVQIMLGILRFGLELAADAIDFDFQFLIGFDASCFSRRKVLVSVDLVLFASKASKGASALPEPKLIPETRQLKPKTHDVCGWVMAQVTSLGNRLRPMDSVQVGKAVFAKLISRQTLHYHCLKLGLEQRFGVLKSGFWFSAPGDSWTWGSWCQSSYFKRTWFQHTWPSSLVCLRGNDPLEGEPNPPSSPRFTQDCRPFLLDRGVSCIGFIEI